MRLRPGALRRHSGRVDQELPGHGGRRRHGRRRRGVETLRKLRGRYVDATPPEGHIRGESDTARLAGVRPTGRRRGRTRRGTNGGRSERDDGRRR